MPAAGGGSTWMVPVSSSLSKSKLQSFGLGPFGQSPIVPLNVSGSVCVWVPVLMTACI